MPVSDMGLIGLAVMGQNFALNVAEKGFNISVFNRSYEKTEAAVTRAGKEGEWPPCDQHRVHLVVPQRVQLACCRH